MIKKLKIESKLSNLGLVENAIDSITRETGIKKEDYGKILVSVMEAVNNAITHGNRSNEKKYVFIDLIVENKELKIRIEDQGSGFKPNEIPDPTQPENIEEVNGRGVFLMKKLADEIQFNSKGNCVIMTFKNIIS